MHEMDSEDSTSGKRERCLYQPLSGLLIKHKPRKALLSGMCLLPMLKQKAWSTGQTDRCAKKGKAREKQQKPRKKQGVHTSSRWGQT